MSRIFNLLDQIDLKAACKKNARSQFDKVIFSFYIKRREFFFFYPLTFRFVTFELYLFFYIQSVFINTFLSSLSLCS